MTITFDDRFPPLPKNAKVPLYPCTEFVQNVSGQDAYCLPKTKRDLILSLAEMYQIKKQNVQLCSSGTFALYTLLKYYQRNRRQFKVVALPDFSCPNLLDAVLAAGLEPYFYSFTETWDIPPLEKESGKFQCLLWPSLWGERIRSKKQLHNLQSLRKKKELVIILDDAQAFPISQPVQSSLWDATIVSFGKSKKIKGSGGGAFLMGSSLEGTPLVYHEHTNNLKERAGTKCSEKKALFSHLGQLLTERVWGEVPDGRICPQDIKNAHYQLKKFEEQKDRLNNRFHWLSDKIANILGTSALSPMRGVIGAPMALAINTPERYNFAQKLAENGIQTTWYYYPLSMVEATWNLSDVSGPLAHTMKQAREILILPFSLNHTDEQFHLLYQGLTQ